MSLPRSWSSNGIAVTFALGTALVAHRINCVVSLPYLDEIFHIPQARQYCQHGLGASYDGKLTTPPGLYLLSVALSHILPATNCNDVGFLRSTNLVMLLMLPHIISAITELNDQEREQRSIADFSALSDATSSNPPPYSQTPAADSSTALQLQRSALSASRRPAQSDVSRATIRGLQQKAQEDDSTRATEIPPPPVGRSLPSGDPLKAVLSKHTVRNKLRTRSKSAYTTAAAHTIAFLPPLYFFAFLYYTDVGSVFFVLSSMLAVKKGALWTGAVLGAVSILFRQTNFVWILFNYAAATLHQLSLRVNILHNPVWADEDASPAYIIHLSQFVGSLQRLRLASTPQAARQRRQFVDIIWQHVSPLLPLLAGFAYFVHSNGGIVLGDKSNHQMGLHVPQLWYFLLFSTIFGWAPLLYALRSAHQVRSHSLAGLVRGSIASLCRTMARSMAGSRASTAMTVSTIALIAASVHKFTIHHPFLLADNRHYTFYLWRRFRAHRAVAYVLVPVYALLLYAWASAAGRQERSVLWITAFALCTAATLVPSPLVEPRYFLIPYLIMRIHIQPSSADKEGSTAVQSSGAPADSALASSSSRWLFLALEFVTALLVNAVTIYLFLYRPFTWPASGVDTDRGESTVMRFMW